MIYTVTFNPSLDYVMKVNDFKLGMVNRSEEEIIFPGGKGINVSIVLKNLGVDNKALGFVAGFTGKEIVNRVEEFGCRAEFIKLQEGLSRINVKLKGRIESEINGGGPHIDDASLEKLYSNLDKLEDGDILVLAGSIPSSLPMDIYEKIMKRLQYKNIKIAVDATKDLLINVLKYKPFFIKPNNHELEEIFNVKLDNLNDITTYAKKLQEMGARNVLVSMGKDGALLITENGQVLISNAPNGRVINSVGAGDSMVAGFICGYLNSNSYEEALKLGSASGSATAFSSDLAKKELIYELIKEIKVERR